MPLPLAAALLLTAVASADAPAAAPPCPGAAEAVPAAVNTGEADLERARELTGETPLTSRGLRRRSGAWTRLACDPGAAPHDPGRRAPAASGLDLRLLPVRSTSVFHSAYSDDRNDGALFAGRGLSTELSAGVEARWRWLSAGVAPLAIWQQNRAFAAPALGLEGYSEFSNPYNFGYLDLPLRMGPGSFWTFDAGQSFVRADAFGVALGWSNENLWWGPGQRNALLMTSSAAGFPHLFVGTSGPVDVWLGWLEAELSWGRLQESGWYDRDGANDRRLLTSVSLTFEPRIAPGLYLGVMRVYDRMEPPGGFDLGDYFTPLTEPFFKEQLARQPGFQHESPENQLVSLTARWVLREARAEVYGEYGRDDHSWDFQDFASEPGHAAAWLLGLQKVAAVGGRRVRVLAEAVRTYQTRAANETRPTPVFYVHGLNRTGYTHRGQMLGAGVGPQADSQFLAVELLGPAGRAGLFLERVLRNERFFHDTARGMRGHDVELTVGARQVHRRGGLGLEWELGRAFRYNANFGEDAVDWRARLSLAWTPEPGRASQVTR